MTATLGTIIEAVRDKVAGVAGLTDAGRVRIGNVLEAPTLPYASIADASFSSTFDGARLGRYMRSFRCTVWGATGADSDTSEARFLAAANLCDLVCRALEADRTLGVAGFEGLIITGAAPFDGADDDLGNVGAFLVEVVGQYELRTGM